MYNTFNFKGSNILLQNLPSKQFAIGQVVNDSGRITKEAAGCFNQLFA